MGMRRRISSIREVDSPHRIKLAEWIRTNLPEWSLFIFTLLVGFFVIAFIKGKYLIPHRFYVQRRSSYVQAIVLPGGFLRTTTSVSQPNCILILPPPCSQQFCPPPWIWETRKHGQEPFVLIKRPSNVVKQNRLTHLTSSPLSHYMKISFATAQSSEVDGWIVMSPIVLQNKGKEKLL